MSLVSLSNAVTANVAGSLDNANLQGAASVCVFSWDGRKLSLPKEEIDAQFSKVPTLQSIYVGNGKKPVATRSCASINTQVPSWNPSTLVPTINSTKIFSHLDHRTLRRCAGVSKTWQNQAIPAAVLQERMLYQALQNNQVIFGPDEWRTYFGDPGVVPPLSPKTYKILKGPCPFWPGKRVEETHLLMCLPAAISGAPLTLNSLGTLAAAPQGGGTATGYDYVWDQVMSDHGNTPTGPARWLLITKQIIRGSGGKSFTDQVALLNARPGYRVAKLGEAVALAFTRRVSGGEFLLSDTWTRCEEQSQGYRLAVGSFTPRGLHVNFNPFNCNCDGVVAVLPCGSSQASGT